MKYSILINQAGIVDAGLHKITDWTDWALLEYVADWQLHGRAHRLDDHVWLNYAHLMDEMPMLGLNAKNSVSNRVKKLVGLDLLSIVHDEDNRVFMKLTDFYLSVVSFRPMAGDVVKPKVRVSAPARPVPVEEHPVPVEEHPVPVEEHPVPVEEHPVPVEEHPVPVEEHTINNQIINNQLLNNQDKDNSVELPQKDFAERELFDHWRSTMGHEKSVLDKKRRAAINNALAWGYSLDVLKQAVGGCANTPHNMGQNDRNQRYDGIELILRSADQIDRFVHNFHHPPQAQGNVRPSLRRVDYGDYQPSNDKFNNMPVITGERVI